MHKPSGHKSNNQGKDYQQRPRHGDTPEQKTDLHRRNILDDKDCGETYEDKNEY
jgi:hypothetical protein